MDSEKEINKLVDAAYEAYKAENYGSVLIVSLPEFKQIYLLGLHNGIKIGRSGKAECGGDCGCKQEVKK